MPESKAEELERREDEWEDTKREESKWRTKTGAILIAISGALLASSKACPVPEWSTWIEWIGTILAAVGMGLMGYGVGIKLDRMAPGKGRK